MDPSPARQVEELHARRREVQDASTKDALRTRVSQTRRGHLEKFFVAGERFACRDRIPHSWKDPVHLKHRLADDVAEGYTPEAARHVRAKAVDAAQGGDYDRPTYFGDQSHEIRDIEHIRTQRPRVTDSEKTPRAKYEHAPS